MISVLIFAVNAKLSCTLEQLPEQDSDISIVGIANDQGSFVRFFDTLVPNVILTQRVPSKEQLGDELRVGRKDAAWMVFVDSKNERTSLEALSAGASAILPLTANSAEIIAAIKMVAEGLAIFPQKLATTLAGRAEIFDRRSGQAGRPILSECERIVLTAMANGLSNKEIARLLGIPFHTVKFHVASILEKLEVETRTEAVIKAAQLGLVML